MKKVIYLSIILSFASFNHLLAQAAKLTEMNKADSIFTFGIASATFDAGKKIDWHYHPGGQILIITDGIGYYQEKGKQKQIVHKGDVIKSLPGVVHWHGGSIESGLTYIAVNPSQKGPTVWKDKVTDDEYQSTGVVYHNQ